MTVGRSAVALMALGAGAILAGCGGSGTRSAPATSSYPAATSTRSDTGQTAPPSALQAEANSAATGDIPDNQVFLVFRSTAGGWSMKYPEGWVQTGSGDRVTFRDKNNIARVVVGKGSVPPTAVVQGDLARLPGVHREAAPQALRLAAGRAVKGVYTTESAPNPVTGKRVKLLVDRYYLGRGGRAAIVDLGTPVGVDNVDAYRLMIESFPLEVESLYREPDRCEEISFGALEFHDVFKIYRSGPAETVALRGLDLRVEQREVVALYGPSGSGKSTVLHLAAGLDQPSAGEVRALGRSLARLDEGELASYRGEEAAIVFQSANLWGFLSARENLAVGLRLARRRGIESAVDRALDAFDLRGREHQPARTLSGGEQQRVAIAAAAARGAPLVLADEPTAELDARNEEIVLLALMRLREEFGSSVVIVTHSPRVAEAVDRVIELRDGKTA